jgi:hypothetical protein
MGDGSLCRSFALSAQTVMILFFHLFASRASRNIIASFRPTFNFRLVMDVF